MGAGQSGVNETRNNAYQIWLAALCSSICIITFWLACRLLLPIWLSVVLTLWLASGPLLSNASRALWSDTVALPFAMIGMYVVITVIKTHSPPKNWGALLASTLCLSFFMKPTYAVPAAAFSIIILLHGRASVRQKIYFLVTCMIWGALFCGLSLLIYGVLIPPYYLPSRVSSYSTDNLIGVLASPGRGVIWFMPTALAVMIAVVVLWRHATLLVQGGIGVAFVIASITMVSGFSHWWGGSGYGPRLLLFCMPLVCFLILLVSAELVRATPIVRKALLSGFGFLALWEAVVHVPGTAHARGWEWNGVPVSLDADPSRLWDWTDPQFLAAFKSRPARAIGKVAEGWILMSSTCSDTFIGDGISVKEPGFRWTDARSANLHFARTGPGASRFAIKVRPYLPTRDPQRLSISLNGSFLGSAVLSQPQWTVLQFDIPARGLQMTNNIRLDLPDARRPTRKSRQLGVAIAAFAITATADASSLGVASACVDAPSSPDDT
jgi:hypothetical protein